MAGKGGAGERRRPRRRARILGGVALVLLGGAFLVWHQRDLPRRTVERELAERLGARVRVGALEIRGARSFALRDLDVRDPGSAPWLDTLRAERVDVEGGVGEILGGRFALLRLSGVEARLVRPTREAAEAPPTSDLVVERLLVENARLLVEAGERAEFTIEADLRGAGAETEGQVRVVSRGFPVAPLLALRGGTGPYPSLRLEQFEADLGLAGAGRELTLDARSGATRIGSGSREIDFPGARLQAGALSDEAAGSIRIDARAMLPTVEQATLWVEIDESTGALLAGEAELSGIGLAEASALLPAVSRGLRVEGRAGLKMNVLRSGVVAYDLDAGIESLEMERDGLRVALRKAGVRLEGTVEPGEPYRGEATARISGDRVRVGGDGFDLLAEGATATGTLASEGGTAPLRVGAELRLPALGGTLGGLELPAAAAPLDLSIHGAWSGPPDRRFDGESRARGPALGELRAGGTIARNGAGTRAALEWDWSGAPAEPFGGLLAALGSAVGDRLSVRGILGGRGRLDGELTAPRLEGEIRADELSVAPAASSGWDLREARSSAAFAWDPDEGELEVQSAGLEGLLRVEPLEPARLRVRGEGTFLPRRGRARVSDAVVELGDLFLARGDGTWDAAASPPVDARMRVDDADLVRWRPSLNALVGDPLPGYSLSGTVRSELRIAGRPGGAWRGEGEIRVASPGLSSEDGSRVVQVTDTTCTVALESPGPGAGLTLEASAPLGGFLLLWGALFGDWSDRPGSLDVRVELPPDAESPDAARHWRARALLDLVEGPRVSADLAATGKDELACDVRTEIADLAPIFEKWVRTPLEGSLQAVEGMRAGGSVAAELRGRLSPRSRILEGRVDLRNASLQTAAGGVEVSRFLLELPLSLRWEAEPGGGFRLVETDPVEGHLAFGRLRFGDVVFEETSSALVVEGDSVALQEGLSIPFLEGVLGLERPALVDAFRPTRVLESGVRLSGISLGALTRALGIVPLEGMVEGHFPRVRLAGNALGVEGDGEFSLLGGRLVVREISGEEVLSRFPKISFSAEFSEIDLQRLTQTFDFGEMNGVLEGWIRDCELFRWVPVRFRARMETVERKGVPQTLNVKAINNIAILGTGGRVSVFDRGIHKFLDRYTYSKLGVEMALARDSFVLRGLEYRGQRELFLKGRLPFRIDVVNAQPGQAVSFRTMLDRLATLDFSTGATAPP